jgi:3-oxoacyl-[acyl-carrier-protein] synthase II
MGAGVGGGAGGLLAAEGMYRNYLNKGPDKVRFSRLAAVYCASTADWIAAWFGLGGPKTTFMTACSSGATAIGWGRDLIAAGLTPVMLAGGTEPICRMTHTAFNALRAVDPEYCKPFSKNRQGLTLGEGAAFMVLEDLDHALARGADILAEVLGYGLSADANHMTAPEPEGDGAVRAIEAALADAGLGPEAVDYVNAHGTGTPANDKTETKALRRVLGGRADQVPVSSTKSMIGHTLGAAGALEAAASVLAIRDRFVPPTIHLEEPDPECDLDYVSQGARDLAVDVVLSNSFAFGGNNTALLLGRHQPEERR